MTGPMGYEPAKLVLTASVARRYYVEGKSKIEIADEFAISRFKVARLLESARTSGLVRIEIGYPGSIDVELSSRLQEAFGLRHSIVVDTLEEDSVALREKLGEAAADLLGEIVSSRDVLGLAWARSVSAMGRVVSRLAPCTVVQLTGALSLPESSIELVRDVARISGGPAYFFYAPMIVPDSATARALRQHPDVARAVDRFASVTKAVVGIGAWEPGQSTVFDAVDKKEQQEQQRQGVRAEISGVLVDEGGATVPSSLSDRMIGVSAEQMRTIPDVIALAYGTAKTAAVRSALQSSLVDGLVTHTALARSLLAAQQGPLDERAPR